MDRYKCFEELLASEDQHAFSVVAVNRHSSICVVAPHGGKIEPGTSELARAVAGELFSLYLFEGRKSAGNRDLHITSTNFNEPSGLSLVGGSDVAIAMHGCQGSDEVIYLGGRHRALIDKLAKSFKRRGFAIDVHRDPMLQGSDRRNLCNRGRSGMGIQFELTRALRDRLTSALGEQTGPTLSDFVDAIREAVSEIEK
ncbi:poly-gamma-glutamate hydrolase family protein [Rhizobium sp. XQZ8]|uniref:poly-gamma-glutamate hydrolase family protein n=1 Tax=Rhizobium populisoli TaxID=2859785 RepID=UPI001C674262|nr:poly-gamma-glutamate hydrolase family protein [Rhizobium populisoli]MBW6424332.1 poly-gamma-glutamate hydrolase family protein [Rhizobium populisoli]